MGDMDGGFWMEEFSIEGVSETGMVRRDLEGWVLDCGEVNMTFHSRTRAGLDGPRRALEAYGRKAAELRARPDRSFERELEPGLTMRARAEGTVFQVTLHDADGVRT